MFENPDFEVDKEAQEYRLLNPVLSRLTKERKTAIAAAEKEQMEVINIYVILSLSKH